jgi:hypothetical protein
LTTFASLLCPLFSEASLGKNWEGKEKGSRVISEKKKSQANGIKMRFGLVSREKLD